MTKNQRRRKFRLELGICERCDSPNNGSSLCTEHRAEETVRARELRRKKRPTVCRCSLCLHIGHNYTTCRLNADSVQVAV